MGPQQKCTVVTGFLERNEKKIDSISSMIGAVAAVVSTIAIIVGAAQVVQGRKALEAQALGGALQSSRNLLEGIEQNPGMMSALTGVSAETIKTNAFIDRVISLFSEQFALARSGVLSQEDWSLFKPNLCAFASYPAVMTRLDQNIAVHAYPPEFVGELTSCPTGQ